MLHPKFVKSHCCEIWGALIGAGASLLGGMMANEQRSDAAAQSTAFNAASQERQIWFADQQAKRQMDFQERMSGSAYQRAVSDLRSAGLNPMLAYSQGGASVPGGAAGSASAAQAVTPAVEDVVTPAIATAQQFRRQELEMENLKATNDLTRAQRDKVAQEAINEGTRSDQIVATTEQLREAAKESRTRQGVNYEEIVRVQEQVKSLLAERKVTEVKEVLGRLSIAEAKVMSEFYQSMVGEASPSIKMLMGILATILRGAR